MDCLIYILTFPNVFTIRFEHKISHLMEVTNNYIIISPGKRSHALRFDMNCEISEFMINVVSHEQNKHPVIELKYYLCLSPYYLLDCGSATSGAADVPRDLTRHASS